MSDNYEWIVFHIYLSLLKMIKILVFGDSIGYGKRDHEGWWVARLRKRVDEKYNFWAVCENAQVYNLSIPGETAVRMVKRFKAEIEMRLVDPNPETKIYVIMAIGINDSCKAPRMQWIKSSLDQFRSVIETMILFCKEMWYEVILVWLSPVDEIKKSWTWSNQEIKKYDAILNEYSKQYNIHFIQLFNLFLDSWLVSGMLDGIHPDSNGHEIIFEEVKKLLKWINT